MLQWSRVTGLRIPGGIAVSGEWSDLLRELSIFIFSPAKEAVPLWSPCRFRGWEAGRFPSREKPEALDVYLAVIDFDESPLPAVLSCVGEVQRRGLAFLLHTTHSHDPQATPPRYKYRLVLPLARPVAAPQWREIWDRVVAIFGTEGMDLKCHDPNRSYYVPSASPTGAPPEQLIGHGEILDPYTLPAAPPRPRTGHTAPVTVGGMLTREMLESYAARLLGAKSGGTQATGQLLKLICQGIAFAQPGDRDNAVWRAACAIGEQWPDADPLEAALLFAPSLSQTGMIDPVEGPFPVERVAEKIKRAQESSRSAQASRAETAAGEIAARCRDAWYPVDRNTVYDPHEIEAMADGYGKGAEAPTAAGRLKRRWVIQKGSTFWVLSPRGFRMCSREDLVGVALTDLAPAYSAGVDLYRVTEKGRVPLSAGEIIAQYGTVAERSISDLLARVTTYEPENRAIVEAPCPPRYVQPKWDPQIAHWISLMGGVNADVINRWLAWFPHLNVPCAALVLYGAGGTGKSLLGHGLACGIWGVDRPTDLDSVAGNWTDGITRCPLLFADDHMPQNSKSGKGVDLGWLRELIQARSHTLKRRYMADTTVRGAIRLLIASQNPDVLSTGENLSTVDVHAISERFVMVETQPTAAEYLKTLPVETKLYWAREGIAAHCLALAQNPSPAEGRFLVRCDSASVQRQIATRGGMGSAVVQALVTAYHMESLPLRIREDLHMDPEGRCWCTPSALAEAWGMLFPGERAPRPGMLTSAIAALSVGSARPRRRGVRLRLTEIDRGTLEAWAEEMGRPWLPAAYSPPVPAG